ncbi:protein kinase domain-containing protein [Pendulispora albinea]|uniref:Serine/threonine-protein kinase n=1 Tax=Pendulispora albinea TaxID=2741071 RepID=A0ABZ2LSL3_9BACT
MSTVTPVTVAQRDDLIADTATNTAAGAPKVGSRIREHIRLDRLLERGEGWMLYLADDEACAHLILVVIATSTAALEACLSGRGTGTVLNRSTLGLLHIAEVMLEEAHYLRFCERLLEPQHAASKELTLESPSSPNEARLAVGSTFAERYRIDGVLGRGGMGEVYRAYDSVFQRTVALKVVLDHASENTPEQRDDAQRRLLNEARLVSVLKHPHIVEIFDAGESAGLPYLVLELCDGGNLRKAMQGDAGQTERLQWLTEIAEALAHAHDRGIVHRDVKPENVLLTHERRAKVTDFGIAKALKREGHESNTLFSIVGTPRYMAPEQLSGKAIDARADQYAWGLVAHELLTKSHPRLREVNALRVDHGATVTPTVPPHLRRVLTRAMAPEPEARYANFHALFLDLQPARRWRGWPVVLGAIAALAVAGVTVGRSIVRPQAPAQATSATPPIATFDTEKVDAETVNRCAPSARPHLAAGLQLWRDASEWEALPKLEEATTLDAECASASLYYIIAASYTFPKRRDHFRHAREHRARLTERERRILDVLEPWVADPPDFAEVHRRAAANSAQMPRDPDFRTLHARALARMGRLDEALTVLDASAALQLNPVAGHEYEAARILIRKRDIVAALDRFDRCLNVSPDSGDCLRWKGLFLASRGDCTKAEAAFRRLISVKSDSQFAHYALANVLLVSTHDATVARNAYEQRWRHLSAKDFLSTPAPDVSRLTPEIT